MTTALSRWYVLCDVCGRKLYNTQSKKRWDGLIVCPNDWEPKHPALTYNHRHRGGAGGEGTIPSSNGSNVRSEPADVSVLVCDVYSSMGVVGYGTTGCARTGSYNLALSPLPSTTGFFGPENPIRVPVTILFFDTFTGGAGPLVGHVPDTSPAPGVWSSSFSPDSFALSGAGVVNPTTEAVGGVSLSRFTPTIAFDATGGFTLTANVFHNDATVDRFIEIILENHFLAVTGNGAGGLFISGTVRDTTLAIYSFMNVSVSLGTHILKLRINNTVARLYVNDVLQETINMVASVPTTNAYLTIGGYALATDSNFAISSIELTSAE